MPAALTHRTRAPHRLAGFTLVELAVVIAVVGLLLGGLVMSVSAQMELQRTNETRETLDRARDALIGFAAANGRLPCPASPASNGQESFCTSVSGGCTETLTIQAHGRCSHFFNGLLPAASLGITPVDNQGYALDGWGNRLRYAVTDNQVISGAFTFTSQDGMRNALHTDTTTTPPTIYYNMGAIEKGTDGTGLLFVCSSANGISGVSCGSTSGTVTITRRTPALVYSTGKNGHLGAVGTDEGANLTTVDRVFVFHDPAPAGAPGGEFDDIMTWLSLPVLFNRMIVAGRLP